MVLTPAYPEALREVKARVAASRTSFHAGMLALPQTRRDAMYALYGFCREVDDIADDSLTLDAAAQGLAIWRQKIADVFRGQASDAITVALLPAIQAFDLAEKDFQQIIDGMAMDAAVIVAPDPALLDAYCDLVASAVGRVSVRIFGDCSDAAMQVAHHLGRALQLTNILRDLAEDAARGRLYLPADLLDKYAIAARNPMAVLMHPALPLVCAELAHQAFRHYRQADLAMTQCLPKAMRPARLMEVYYRAILEKLAAENWRDPLKRVSLPRWKKFALLLKGYLG